MNRKQKIIVSITGIFIVLLALVGLTYAYFLTRITGNTNPTSISVTTKDLRLEYEDGEATMSMTGLIEPGFEATKAFSVENTGNTKVNFSIKLDNMTNTFTRYKDWTFTLTQDGEEIKTGYIPNKNGYIVNSIEIEPNVTYDYVLYITYENKNEDQSIDMNKTLEFRVNIDEEVASWDDPGIGTLLSQLKANNTVTDAETFANGVSKFKIVEGETGTFYAKSADTYITYADAYEFNENTGTYSLINVKYDYPYGNDLTGKYLAKIPEWFMEEEHPSKNLAVIYEITSSASGSYADDSYDYNRSFTYKTIKSTKEDGYYTAPGMDVSKNDEKLLLTTEDDYGISYYFRGNVDNNFVTYSGMCWRIVRIDGNGNVKLVLADEDHECGTNKGYNINNGESAFIGDTTTQAFKEYDYNGIIYSASPAKKVLESWANGGDYQYIDINTNKTVTGTFERNLNLKNIVEAEWCNDTSVSEGEEDDISDTREYSGYDRLYNNSSPSLKCDFTGLGNTKSSKVTSIIGMLTADEIAFAGAVNGIDNINYYLYPNATGRYWTITPSTNFDYNAQPNFWYVNGGTLKYDSLYARWYNDGTDPTALRPSIVLKSNVKLKTDLDYTQDGTIDKPYVIK